MQYVLMYMLVVYTAMYCTSVHICHAYTGSTAGAIAQITSIVSTINSTVTDTSAIYQTSNTQSNSVKLSQLSNRKQGTV